MVLRASGGKVEELTAQRLEHTPFNEDALQKLLAEHPELLPVREIEPAYVPLACAGREVDTRAGPIDLLFVTPTGNLVVVETKLWRNAEARRSVVAQILDYAKALARLSYREFDALVVKATGRRLADLARGICANPEEEFDEQEFVDAVTRNLRACRLLLLIVGEGIREGVEELTNLLQDSGGRRFSLALIELPLYRLEKTDFPLLVAPRVIAHTKEILRAVVELRHVSPSQVEVLSAPTTTPSDTGARTTLSEEDFLSALQRAAPGTEAPTRSLLARLESLGCVLNWVQSGVSVRVEAPPESGKYFTLLVITKNASCYLGWLERVEARGYGPEIARAYERQLAALGLRYNWETRSGPMVTLAPVLNHADQLTAAVTQFIGALRKADDEREE